MALNETPIITEARAKIGSELQQKREAAGLTRYQVSIATGISHNQVVGIEESMINYTINSLLAYKLFIE